MSNKARDWAAHYAPMLLTKKGKPDTTARAILVELADHANDQGTNCFPGPAHLEWATGFDQATIKRALLRLERGGLITKDGTKHGAQGYKLELALQRPRTDLQFIEARIAEERRVESYKRSARRRQAKMSGTQSAGHPDAEDVDTIIEEMADHAGMTVTADHARWIYRDVIESASTKPSHPLSYVLNAIREQPHRYRPTVEDTT